MSVTGYKGMDKEANDTNEEVLRKVFKGFPDINADLRTKEANKLFTPYLFFHWPRGHKEVELWSSCCNRNGTMPNPPRTVTTTEMNILYGHHNDKAVCPYCGRTVTLKETGRLGKRKNLLEYKSVVILKANRGNLYARAYWARKDYQENLDAPPQFFLVGAYAFRKGSADMIVPDWWRSGYQKRHLEGNYDPNHRVITEPFTEDTLGGYRYVPYTVLGLEEIGKSDFRYCQYETFERATPDNLHWNLMKYLAAASIYPVQIEMLIKSGFRELVADLVCRRRKNSKVINWGEKEYLKAFGLSKQEMREWKESGCSYELIGEYKMLRTRKLHTNFWELHEIREAFGYQTDKVLQSCRKWKIKPIKLGRYLSKFCGGCPGGVRDIRAAWQHWKDYADMAKILEWDLKVETVLLPPDLYGRHDEAAQELALRTERERAKDLNQARVQGLIKIHARAEKYNFEMEDYFIKVAECAEDVRLEGKTLEHCVGGYAERHMAGKTTILFLRRKEAPNASLYTIEMDGNRLCQIHGFRNERGGAPDPRKTMAWMLDPWLAWLKKGSPRNKDGSPKLPKKKTKEAHAA